MTFRIGSLCTGYGGLDCAVQAVFGGELVFVADNDPGAAAILAHRFPAVKNLGDITKVRWDAVEPVDVLCAGFPCTDISAAGRRAGLLRGNRSGLWHEIAVAIGVLRPKVVVIENVRALLTARGDEPVAEHVAAEANRDSARQLLAWLDNEHNIAIKRGDIRRVRQCGERTARVLGARKRAVARCQWHERRLVRAIGTVLGSLADCGYDAEWVTVPASDAGAPHRRERVFIIAADARGGEFQRRGVAGVVGGAPSGEPGEGNQRERAGDATGGSGATSADADVTAGGERRQPAPGQAEGRGSRADAGGRDRAPAADAERDGWQRRAEGGSEAADEPGQGPWAAIAGRGTGPARPAGHGRGTAGNGCALADASDWPTGQQ